MGLWGTISDWWDKESEHLVFRYIADGEALKANDAYFRIWLADMFLAKGKSWGQDQWPAVHTTVQLAYASEDRARFTKVAQPPKEQLGVGVRNNYHLTPLLPFTGGIVEIESALVELKGANPIKTAISVLEDFSSLVGAPLATALKVADKVASGVTKLADTAGGIVQLGLHQSLVAQGGNLDNTLRPGYLVVVNARAGSLDEDSLVVVEGRLHGADGRPLTGYDYMVFGVEHRLERDDYNSLFSVPFNAAKNAAILKKDDEFQEKSRLLYAAVLTSSDLTQDDQQRQYVKYKALLSTYLDTPLGAVPSGDSDDLDELLRASPDVVVPAEPVTLADVFAM